MKMPLEIIDYQNLLILSRDQYPLWTVVSLDRCEKARLVNAKGDFLTREGRRKAQRLAESVEKLQAGLPLDVRCVDRTSEFVNGMSRDFVRSAHNHTKIWFNDEAIFKGNAPHDSSLKRVSIEDKQFAWVAKEIRMATETSNRVLTKLHPYAVQIDRLDGMETICLRFSRNGLIGTGRVKGLRIQSKYYDFVISSLKEPSFWCNADRLHGPIFIKNTFGSGLGNKIHALIMPVMPVVSFDWPLPSFDGEN